MENLENDDVVFVPNIMEKMNLKPVVVLNKIKIKNLGDDKIEKENVEVPNTIKMENRESTAAAAAGNQAKGVLTPVPNNLGHFEVDLIKQRHEQLKLKHRERTKLNIIHEQQEAEIKKQRALKGMSYILTKSLKFSDFFKDKLKQHQQPKEPAPVTRKGFFMKKPRFQLADMLSDDMFKENTDKESSSTVEVDILNQISLFEGGVLKPYQVEGLTWMTILFENGVNGILADEMGLGKTVQVIALICHLYERKVAGPFLIVAPLSTIPNWVSEFKRFAPQVPVVVFHGNKLERKALQWDVKKNYKLLDHNVKPVVVTTYQMPLIEQHFMTGFRWQYIIIDEGHRIKNHQSKLAIVLRDLKSINKLLLTGTPLQNNLTELWSLLNFLLPHIFTDVETFASLLAVEDMADNNKIVSEAQSTDLLSTIHKVLAPFMLRRLKCDVLVDLVPKKEVLVYCPMSQLQRDLYTYIVQRNSAKLYQREEVDIYEPRQKRKCTMKGSYAAAADNVEDLFMDNFIKEEENLIGGKLDKKNAKYLYSISLSNTIVMCKKTVDHPYLINFPLDPNSDTKQLLVNEDIVLQSGKMLVLDAMLAKLLPRGHKVLLFSTFVIQLDLIEEYLIMRNYEYCRLDGNNGLQERQESIAKFTANPDIRIFLISTRAGGLGLNLAAADTVILYDRDWNPQVDIQAQDRCHRIGQTRPVMVYTLVTKNTIDEQIIKRGVMKRRLEKIIIKDGKFKSIKGDDKNQMDIDYKELLEMLEKGDSSTIIHSNGYVFTDEELDNLLDRSELYKEMEETKKRLNII